MTASVCTIQRVRATIAVEDANKDRLMVARLCEYGLEKALHWESLHDVSWRLDATALFADVSSYPHSAKLITSVTT
jgi:hypothetical protein